MKLYSFFAMRFPPLHLSVPILKAACLVMSVIIIRLTQIKIYNISEYLDFISVSMIL